MQIPMIKIYGIAFIHFSGNGKLCLRHLREVATRKLRSNPDKVNKET